jgi:hypothetical protein
MVGTSGIYYLLVSEFGSHKSFDKAMESRMEGSVEMSDREDKNSTIMVKTDTESMSRGNSLFNCHDPHSTKTGVGPGLKGVLSNPLLPVSKRPATPENIVKQLRNPYERMPPFAHLQEDELANIISFLNTL